MFVSYVVAVPTLTRSRNRNGFSIADTLMLLLLQSLLNAGGVQMGAQVEVGE